MRKFVLTGACLLALAASELAQAIPKLQLYIAPGCYGTTEESTVATANSFTLYAYLSGDYDSRAYYLSAAVVPSVGPAQQQGFGSFLFNGAEIAVTDDMLYGTAPIETVAALQGFDSGDLPKHGVFKTFFYEFSLDFDSNETVAAYNVVTGEPASGKMYKKEFSVDVSGMPDGYGIHFDLYSKELKEVVDRIQKGETVTLDYDVDSFAPFSHDATGYRIPADPETPVPDRGTTAALLGLSMLAVGLFAWRKA
ncbi:MAG: choice-of-anchor N protein [Verrucomicrobiia bacterium]